MPSWFFVAFFILRAAKSESMRNLEQRLEELQRSFATQQQMETIRQDLASAQGALNRMESSLQNLVQFTQNNLQPEMNRQLQEALQTLERVQEAVANAQQTLFDQGQTLEQRHGLLLQQLQRAGGNLASVATLVNEVNQNLKGGQQNLANALGVLLRELTSAHQALSMVVNQVQILTGLQQTIERMEADLGRLSTVLLRRSGQVGEHIVTELLSILPDDWIERNVRLGTGEVEFALRLPGDRLIPLDSKFVGQELLQQLEGHNVSEEKRQQIAKQIQQQVQLRLKRWLNI